MDTIIKQRQAEFETSTLPSSSQSLKGINYETKL